ncbi:geranylgeranyl reductase family protein [Geoglobus ahangari]
MLVVGGGPAGSLSAANLSERAEVTLVEAKGVSGFPAKCGGLISEDCFEALSRYCRASRALQNRIDGAFFFSPSGRYAELRGKSRAVVVERKALDPMLLQAASKSVDVRMKTRFDGADGGKVRLVEQGEERFERFDIVIGADGPESMVARTYGFERPEIFTGKQYLMEFEPIDERMVELYFGKKYSSGFFAYVIPVEKDVARVGVVSRGNTSVHLERLLTSHPSVSERAGRSIYEVNSGPIPIGLVDFVRDGVALVGDSAGMVKPYTGGGMYYLLRAAELLGEHFPDMEGFRKSYLKEMGREYSSGERIRRLYDSLDDEDYDFLIEVARDVDFSSLHMDSPSTALKLLPEVLKLVKRPSIAVKIARAMV